MALAPGSRVGPYEVTALLGEGGMGKVWRARHTALKRDDALKVLPDAFAADPERLARFQREAEVLASLNHPNIAHVYGLEEGPAEAGHYVRALVMELVEGPTLADRIAQGAIPMDEALPIARQIADALEAAHERGIIHRDLKPANIKLRPDGVVKVLDFGLAKLTGPAEAGHYVPQGGAVDRSVRLQPDLTGSPTITSPAMMTGVGVILGTAAYMSPEQARGRAVDKRADIWAFGCVLYEMITGKRAFDGDDVTVTLARVVEREPDLDALPPSVPARVRQALRVCLRKDPKQRVGDIRDVRLALEGAFETAPAQAVETMAVAPPASWLRVAMLAASALVTGAVMAGAGVWFAMHPVPPQVTRTTITTSGATALSVQDTDRDLAVTPDGSRVVYRGNGQILVRTLDQLDPTPLGGVGNLHGPFMSPDGQWVGFFDGNRQLKKVAITGGPPVTLATVDGNGARGATWGEDGTIIFATNLITTGLQRVSAAGGDVTLLTKPNREGGEGDHFWPEVLPGGHAVLFTINSLSGIFDDRQIAVLDLRNGTWKVLIRGGSHARYVPSGHLVYGAAGSLRAVAFDLDRLEVMGTAVPVVPEVVTTSVGAADFDVAENGTLVYVLGSSTSAAPRRSLVWIDRQGREEPLKAPERGYVYPRLSPDGTRVALSIRDQQDDIWVWDLTRDILTRFTFGPEADQYPAWMPDGRRLLFGTTAGSTPDVFWQAADGTGSAERLTESSQRYLPYSVSPDGSRVVLREGVAQYDLAVLLLGNERRTEPLVRTAFSELNAEVSPDGRWLAYESNESGQREVYVRPFPNVDAGRWQVSGGGGTRPLWARNGQELFYLATTGADAIVMTVQVERGATWRAGTPTKLFAGRFFYAPEGIGEGRTYDVAPDGRRFLMIKEAGGFEQTAAPTNLIVVQNWLEELKRLVPTN